MGLLNVIKKLVSCQRSWESTVFLYFLGDVLSTVPQSLGHGFGELARTLE